MTNSLVAVSANEQQDFLQLLYDIQHESIDTIFSFDVLISKWMSRLNHIFPHISYCLHKLSRPTFSQYWVIIFDQKYIQTSRIIIDINSRKDVIKPINFVDLLVTLSCLNKEVVYDNIDVLNKASYMVKNGDFISYGKVNYRLIKESNEHLKSLLGYNFWSHSDVDEQRQEVMSQQQYVIESTACIDSNDENDVESNVFMLEMTDLELFLEKQRQQYQVFEVVSSFSI